MAAIETKLPGWFTKDLGDTRSWDEWGTDTMLLESGPSAFLNFWLCPAQTTGKRPGVDRAWYHSTDSIGHNATHGQIWLTVPYFPRSHRAKRNPCSRS